MFVCVDSQWGLFDNRESLMESPVACPVCGAEPGESCQTTLGRPITDHKARIRRARPDRPAALATDNTGPVSVTARFSPAASRRLVLEHELAAARARHQQLQFVIDYLEGELLT